MCFKEETKRHHRAVLGPTLDDTRKTFLTPPQFLPFYICLHFVLWNNILGCIYSVHVYCVCYAWNAAIKLFLYVDLLLPPLLMFSITVSFLFQRFPSFYVQIYLPKQLFQQTLFLDFIIIITESRRYLHRTKTVPYKILSNLF